MKYLKLLIFLMCIQVVAQVENEKFKPGLFYAYSKDTPETHTYGAFHYTSINNVVMDDYFGSFFSTGMMHTWYKPEEIYNQDDYTRDIYGYHTMEGGAGYRHYSRFHNYLTPHKFSMGAVAGGFGSFSNGPGSGSPGFNNSANSSTLRWELNTGRYGAALISNSLLFPLDGIGFEGRANNKMFGYGYYALPFTEPKDTTAGQDIPTGNYSWTLFLNAENFSGPVAFHTPYHWSKYSLTNENAVSRCFDNSLLEIPAIFQRETGNLPAKKWTDSNGDVYYKCSPVFMPIDDDGIGRFGTMPMNMDSTMWDSVSEWFNGGSAPPQNFDQKASAIHTQTSTGMATQFKFDNSIIVSSSEFATSFIDPNDPHTAAFKWNLDIVKKVEGRNLIQLPEYYVYVVGDTRARVIDETKVPDESGLKEINSRADYEDDWDYYGFNRDPVFTPMHPDFTYSDEIVDVWKSPGPTSGPYYTDHDDGSTSVYYWYKFNEQPSILNSDMDETERQLAQERVELMHKNWNKYDGYLPEPTKEKVSLDNGLLVTPPPGLEVGYVPISIHQQLSNEEFPEFPEINLYTPPLKVYIIAGQSNAVGHGVISNDQLPGTLDYTLKNDTTGKYDFLDDGNGGYISQDDAWIYFEKDGTLMTGNLEPGYGDSASKMGLEVTFGKRMQKYTKQKVLLIKAAWGGKNLAVDFRPPSSSGDTGLYYNEILRVVDDALDNVGNYFPEYDSNAGYEISGFLWHQGWNDHVSSSRTAEYTENLANLIKDLRTDIGVNFPVAIATTAMPKLANVFEENTIYKDIELAQLAIADTDLYPEFEGNVIVVDAKEYWISPTLSPIPSGGQHFHWNQNAKIYMDLGLGLADALFMIKDNDSYTNKLVSYRHNSGNTNPSWINNNVSSSSELGGNLSGGVIETNIDQLSVASNTGLNSNIPSNDFNYYFSYKVSTNNEYIVHYDRLALIAFAEDKNRSYQLSYIVDGQDEVFITSTQVLAGTLIDQSIFDSYSFTDFSTALDVEFRVYWQGSGESSLSRVFIDKFDLYGTTEEYTEPIAEALIYDTFNRDDNEDLNASTDGQSGLLAPASYTTQTYSDVEFGIINDQISIDGPATSGEYGALFYINNINFSSNVIDPNYWFSIEIDIINYRTAGSARYMGVGIGQSLQELLGQVGVDPTNSLADLFVGYRNTTGALEIYKNGILDSEESRTSGISKPPTTMRIECDPNGFRNGQSVQYRIYFGESLSPFTSGSFLWSGTDENYISLSSNLSKESIFDNLVVRSFENLTLSTDSPTIDQSIEVKLYPNPFDDGFSIQIPKYDGLSNVQVKLMDLSGKIVKQENYQQSNISFTGLSLSQGVYLLKINYNNGKHYIVKKVLKI